MRQLSIQIRTGGCCSHAPARSTGIGGFQRPIHGHLFQTSGRGGRGGRRGSVSSSAASLLHKHKHTPPWLRSVISINQSHLVISENSVNNLIGVWAAVWTLHSSYISGACILKKAKGKEHCTASSSCLSTSASHSVLPDSSVSWMNQVPYVHWSTCEADGTTDITWSNIHVPGLCVRSSGVVRHHHPWDMTDHCRTAFGTDPDLQICRWHWLLAPFFS